MCSPSRPVAAAFLLTMLVSGAAAAEDTATLNKMVEINRKAIADLQAGDPDAAKDALLSAVVMGKQAGLATHMFMARTYMHLAAVQFALKDKEKAQRNLVLALKIRPDMQLTPQIASAGLTEVFAAAHAELGMSPAPKAAAKPANPSPPPPEPTKPVPAKVEAAKPEPPKVKPVAKPAPKESNEPDLPATIPSPLHCPMPDEAPPEQEIAFRCVPKPGTNFTKIVMFYRPASSEVFVTAPLSKTPKGWYVASIPGKVVTGKALHYYVEALGPANKVMLAFGNRDSPNLVSITAGAATVGKGTLAALKLHGSVDATDEAPRAPKDDDPLRVLADKRERENRAGLLHRRNTDRGIYVGLGVGTGYGWHMRRDFERHVGSVNAGLSPGSLVNFTPEVGIQWDESLAFSIQTRHQYLPLASQGDPTGKPPGSFRTHAVLARATYFWATYDNLQLFGTGNIGAGSAFRLLVAKRPGLPGDDTINGGPFVFGPGVGALYHQSKHLAIVAEARSLVGVGNVAVLVDLNVGAAFAF